MKSLTFGALALLCLLLASACGSKDEKPATDSSDGACGLERPGELSRPPARGLPCELLPPGWQR